MLDARAKDLVPSTALPRSFGHHPRRWRTFITRYREELRAPAVRAILDALTRDPADAPAQ